MKVIHRIFQIFGMIAGLISIGVLLIYLKHFIYNVDFVELNLIGIFITTLLPCLALFGIILAIYLIYKYFTLQNTQVRFEKIAILGGFLFIFGFIIIILPTILGLFVKKGSYVYGMMYKHGKCIIGQEIGEDELYEPIKKHAGKYLLAYGNVLLYQIKRREFAPNIYKTISCDAKGFKNFGYVIGIDKNKAYCFGDVLDLDIKTFKALGFIGSRRSNIMPHRMFTQKIYNYVKDSKKVYFVDPRKKRCIEIPEADAETFEVTSDGSVYDKNHVYYKSTR